MGITTRSKIVRAPASRVWSVIGDYNNVQVFHPFVESADQMTEADRGVGAARQCNLYNGSSLMERVVEWNEGTSFVVAASPQRFFGEVRGGMRVEPIDAESSRVTLHTEYTPAGGFLGTIADVLVMRAGIGYALRRVLEGLRSHLETGAPVARRGRPAKEYTIHLTSEPIAVPAADLWDLLGPGFGEVGAWTTSVDRSHGAGEPQFEGAPFEERVCQVNISGYERMTERLTHYDESKRELAYVVGEGLPSFVLLAQNHWTIKALDANTSVAEMRCTLRLTPMMGMLVGALMKRKARSSVLEFLTEMKQYAETGEVSEAKKKRLSVLVAPAAAAA
ncbi:MAG: SRPBCC family protein [Deltaproteobacteria bacterium]|nr:SRPBCC family protein [Deltaproteobacteria bacterium]